MTREEAITVFKAFMENPLFSDVHKAAFNIAIHDIKQRHDWDINNLILINKENYELLYTDEEISKSFIEDVEAVKDLLPTTKNDLGVDCISRAEARKAIIDHQYSDSFCEEHNIDHSINTGMALIALSDLPSVTPQEPILDKIFCIVHPLSIMSTPELEHKAIMQIAEMLEPLCLPESEDNK